MKNNQFKMKNSDASPYILYGEKTKRKEIPWHVGIYDSDNAYFCGGTLISASKILSAAHCFGENPEIGGTLIKRYIGGKPIKEYTFYYKAVVGSTKADF